MKELIPAQKIKNPFYRFLCLGVGTGLGLGYVPFAPGTAGSLLGIVLGLCLIKIPIWQSLIVLGILCVITLPLIKRACEHFGQMDSPKIVWDEVIGQALGMLSLRHFVRVEEVSPPWTFVLASFFIFRLLDIVKPFPAKTLDNTPTAFGVMADDVVCGLYTALILHAFIRLSPAF
jgi:phosphatidylglycerophosphatase A